MTQFVKLCYLQPRRHYYCHRRHLKQIAALIERADRLLYRVIVQALDYISNESKLRDIGSQASIVFGTADRSTVAAFCPTAGLNQQR